LNWISSQDGTNLHPADLSFPVEPANVAGLLRESAPHRYARNCDQVRERLLIDKNDQFTSNILIWEAGADLARHYVISQAINLSDNTVA
jgi:hypothetical protein